MAAWFFRRDDRPRTAATRATVCAVLVIVVSTVVAFSPIRRNGFVSVDDSEYITQNAAVKGGLTAQGVALAFSRSHASNWHPLTWISHMVDVELFGLDPRGHHLVGVAIHLAAALVLLLTLQALTGRAGPSFLAAALFALHPLHVESVAWAAERKDVLSALFWMLALAAYLRYARRPGVVRFLPVPLFFALGLMAKPMVVTLPLVLLLLDFWPLGRHRAAVAGAATAARPGPLRLVLEKVPLFALAALSGLITLQAQTAGGAVTSLEAFPLAARAANALLSWVGYLGKTLWPSGLAVFYPFRIRSLTDPGVLAAGAFVAAASVAVFRLRRRRPWLLSGWLWYLIMLLPVIGLVQVGDQAMADRYTYLPLIGVFVAGAWELDGVARRRNGARVALAGGAMLALLLLAGQTRRQVAVWKDDETLNGHAARVTADNWWATYHLGLARESAGDRDGALRFYREALRMKPDFSRGRYAYALALEQEGRVAEAAEQLRTVRRALPADPVIGMRLALLLDREGWDDEAIQVLRELIARRPEIAEVCNNLAVLLSRRGQVEEAAALLRRAVALDPAYAEARRNLQLLTGEPPAGGGAGE